MESKKNIVAYVIGGIILFLLIVAGTMTLANSITAKKEKEKVAAENKNLKEEIARKEEAMIAREEADKKAAEKSKQEEDMKTAEQKKLEEEEKKRIEEAKKKEEAAAEEARKKNALSAEYLGHSLNYGYEYDTLTLKFKQLKNVKKVEITLKDVEGKVIKVNNVNTDEKYENIISEEPGRSKTYVDFKYLREWPENYEEFEPISTVTIKVYYDDGRVESNSGILYIPVVYADDYYENYEEDNGELPADAEGDSVG